MYWEVTFQGYESCGYVLSSNLSPFLEGPSTILISDNQNSPSVIYPSYDHPQCLLMAGFGQAVERLPHDYAARFEGTLVFTKVLRLLSSVKLRWIIQECLEGVSD